MRYPRAGTANAIVTLHVLGLDGERVDVAWDREAFEYLVAVSWTEKGRRWSSCSRATSATCRCSRSMSSYGTTEVVWADHDERGPTSPQGVPAWLPGGRLVTAGHRDDTRSLLIDGDPVSRPGCRSTR